MPPKLQLIHEALMHQRPAIQAHDLDTILELLCRSVLRLHLCVLYCTIVLLTLDSCRLLAPIGQYREISVVPSKGKRSKKRKRAAARAEAAEWPSTTSILAADAKPSVPAINGALTIGFNSTQRHLETAARRFAPGQTMTNAMLDPRNTQLEPSSNTLAAVFVDRSSQAPILHSHLPLLVSAASTPTIPVRLVALPNGSETRLRTALGIPRVGVIGIRNDAPDATPLLNFVKEHVPTVDVPWLKNAEKAEFLPVAINVKTALSVKDSTAQKHTKKSS